MCFENKIESLCIQYGFFFKQFNLMTENVNVVRILYKAYYVLESNDEYYYYYYTLL